MSIIDTSKTTWDFSYLYKSIDDPQIQIDMKQLEDRVDKFVLKWESRTDYLQNPEILAQALSEYESYKKESGIGNTGKFSYFVDYSFYIDMNNSQLQSLRTKVQEFSVRIDNKLQFFLHKISRIDSTLQAELLKSDKLYPWKHFLESAFKESQFLLSEEVEKVVNLKANSAYSNWLTMRDKFLSNESATVVDENGIEIEKSFEEILSLINSSNKIVRDKAAIELNRIFEKNIEMATWELNSVLEYRKVEDELRGYKRSDEFMHLSDDIDTEIIDTLSDSVKANNSISHRLYELKAKLFGLDKLGYHERNLEYGKNQKSYTWQEAVDLVYKVLNNLDAEFGSIFKEFVESGQVDVYPRNGKTGGAFCEGGESYSPVHILMNFTGNLNDITTLAHETGHGINHYLMHKHQSPLNFGSSFFTAETASTFMEDFVLEEILKTADDEMRLSILITKLSDDVNTIFRSNACDLLQRDLHRAYRQEGFLSKEKIGQIFINNMRDYMGDFVSYDEGSQNWWVYWQHIREYPLYSYVGGLLISKSMQALYKENPENIIKIKQWFGMGSIVSPKESFKALNIDIGDKEFWFKGLNQMEQLLIEVETLAKKLGKIS